MSGSNRWCNAAWVWWRRFFLAANVFAPVWFVLTGGLDPRVWIYAVFIHGIFLVGMFVPSSNILGPILNRIRTDKKEVWLTIDDGPSADTLPLARMLEAKGARATFFFRGDALATQPEVAAELVRHGQEIANHTMSHPLGWFWVYLPSQVAREIDGCAAVMARAGVKPVSWFRCPAGVKNPFLHSILRRRGLGLAGWTVRAYDGVQCDAEAGLQRIREKLCPGAVILVHEGKDDAAGNPASLAFISRLVDEILQAGYDFTTPAGVIS